MRRHLPERALPAYAFVPGQHPHPTRAPGGHAHGRAHEPLDTAFVWGVDLYNHGYAWEAHEAWEGLWQAAKDNGERAQAALYQGLIQCAAACLKLRQGRVEIARRLGTRACAHLQLACQGDAETHGLDVPAFVERFSSWLFADTTRFEARPRIELARHAR